MKQYPVNEIYPRTKEQQEAFEKWEKRKELLLKEISKNQSKEG